MSLYLEDLLGEISEFLEEDREQSKSYGEMADFQDYCDRVLGDILDGLTCVSELEDIKEEIEDIYEELEYGYINSAMVLERAKEIKEERESELEDLIEDHKEEWAQDYCNWYGIDCDDEYFDIGMIDEFFEKPSDLMEAMTGEYRGENYFRINVYGWVEFDDYGTDWEQVFEDYDVRDKVLEGDRCIEKDYGAYDLAQEIEDLEELIDELVDL